MSDHANHLDVLQSKQQGTRQIAQVMGSLSKRSKEMQVHPVRKKNRGGCEIEARCISYKINSLRKEKTLGIWSRDNEEEEEEEVRRTINIEQKNDGWWWWWRGRTETRHGRNHRHVRHVLNNVSCRAKPWELLAIVGPSGAGKSTFLEILAGKLPIPLSPQSASSILVNRKPIDKDRFRKISGYVTQKDTLFPLLTVRETLFFMARLRLHLHRSQISIKVDHLIEVLGLEHVANARVGDDKVRGISGGERRRVSIGVEVIHDPKVLILDEPTSGLDSTSALQIVGMLKTMAEVNGRTVVLSVHQPGFRIVKLFSSVLLLADGCVLHHGTVDQLQGLLRSAGLELPSHVNTVEFAIDSIEDLQLHRQQVQLRHKKTGNHKRNNRCTLEQLFQHSEAPENVTTTGNVTTVICSHCNHRVCSTRGYANSWIGETAILTHRYLNNVFRTKELFACRTIQMLVSGLVIGSIFYNLGETTTTAREVVGMFAFILTFLLSSSVEALPIFLNERVILMKEISSGSYRLSSYVLANGLVFLPFLLILAVLFAVPLYWLVGLSREIASFTYFFLLIWLILYTANSVVVCFSAIAPDFIVGNSMVNGIMGAFFLFSGYFIRKDGMPGYWVFMHYISLFKYPFEGFLVNEFSDKCLEYRDGLCLVKGEHVLKEVGLREDSKWKNLAIMVGLIALYRFLSYLFLKCRFKYVQKGGLRRAVI